MSSAVYEISLNDRAKIYFTWNIGKSPRNYERIEIQLVGNLEGREDRLKVGFVNKNVLVPEQRKKIWKQIYGLLQLIKETIDDVKSSEEPVYVEIQDYRTKSFTSNIDGVIPKSIFESIKDEKPIFPRGGSIREQLSLLREAVMRIDESNNQLPSTPPPTRPPSPLKIITQPVQVSSSTGTSNPIPIIRLRDEGTQMSDEDMEKFNFIVEDEFEGLYSLQDQMRGYKPLVRGSRMEDGDIVLPRVARVSDDKKALDLLDYGDLEKYRETWHYDLMKKEMRNKGVRKTRFENHLNDYPRTYTALNYDRRQLLDDDYLPDASVWEDVNNMPRASLLNYKWETNKRRGFVHI